MQNTSQNLKIKPILSQSIHIQNIHQHREFIKKRPKKAISFKFSFKDASFDQTGKVAQNVQSNLHQALKLLKPLQEVDLSEFKVEIYSISPAKSLSIFKRVSKIPSIRAIRCQHYQFLPKNFTEKWIRYLPNLHSLDYEITGNGLFDRMQDPPLPSDDDIKDPLRYIRCCPKLQSLKMNAFGISYTFPKIFMRFNQDQTHSLKHLFIKSPLEEDQVDFPKERFQNLESIGLRFCSNYPSNFVVQNLLQLSDLPKLTEMSLYFDQELSFECIPIFKKLADRGTLKKLRLILDYRFFKQEELLKILQDFNQLTHFTLKIYIQDDTILPQISESIQKMTRLEDLKLSITNNSPFKASEDLNNICKQVSKFELLSHLKLTFQAAGLPEDKDRIPSFLPHLHGVLAKPIKLKTLSLNCNQLDPSDVYPKLFTDLENSSSSSSLQRLKIAPRPYSFDTQNQKMINSFIQNLCNVRILQLPKLSMASRDAFDQYVETIKTLKHLKVLKIGGVEENVGRSECLAAIEGIIKKKGLERFETWTGFSLTEGGGMFGSANSESPVDMKQVIRKNIFLENVKLSFLSFPMNFFDELYKWV